LFHVLTPDNVDFDGHSTAKGVTAAGFLDDSCSTWLFADDGDGIVDLQPHAQQPFRELTAISDHDDSDRLAFVGK
jgi:hypothetical protein